jgi:hypothetical protein
MVTMKKKFSLLIAMLAATAACAVPSVAKADYLHAENCWNGLRYGTGGDYDHDDDVHRYGVASGYARAEGPKASTHYDNTHVLIVVWYFDSAGTLHGVNGYCHGVDGYFKDDLPGTPPGW